MFSHFFVRQNEMALEKKLKFGFLTFMWILCILTSRSNCQEESTAKIDKLKSVKKDLNTLQHVEIDKVLLSHVVPTGNRLLDGNMHPEKVVIEEKPQRVISTLNAATEASARNISTASSHLQVEDTNFKSNIYQSGDDIPDSFKSGFYFFIGLSSLAVLFIIVKVYRLRLSRAERKYGVQGDRTTQELTPLPLSIEDGNSDEDDQTLFELNRQQIRIL